MDRQALVAAHMPDRRRPEPMGASAEDRYYRSHADQITLPHPGARLLGAIATAAGVILLLVGVALA